MILKEALGGQSSRQKTKVERWRHRVAMSAGKGIEARWHLEVFGKYIKTLILQLQNCKDLAVEHEEGSSKLQESLEGVQKENGAGSGNE